MPQHLADATLPSSLARVLTTGAQVHTTDITKTVYRASIIGVTPVAAATDFIQFVGSSTKTIRIKTIRLNGVATANGNMPVQVIRRSTIGTIGSAVVTPIVIGKLDKNDAAATLTVGTIGTANWTTLGTAAGVMGASRLFLTTTATGTPASTMFDFTQHQDKGLVLRGTSDWVVVNLNGAAVPAGTVIDIEIEFEEDNS